MSEPEETPVVRPARKGGRPPDLRDRSSRTKGWQHGLPRVRNPRGINQHSSVPSFRQLMEAELNRQVPRDDVGPPKKETNKAALVRTAVAQARKGNLTALMWLVERVEGKVPDHVVQDVRNAIVMVPWNDEEADFEYLPRGTADHVLPAPGETLPPRRSGDRRKPLPDEVIHQEQTAEGSQGHTSEG